LIRVVLVEPEGEYNVGFIARLCRNFDVKELYIVKPKCDLEQAKNFSAKGLEYLSKAKIVNNLNEALQGVDVSLSTSSIADSQGDMLRKSVTPEEAAKAFGDRHVALVFGRESVGLTREEIEMTDFLVHIPATPDYPVLNLSHAVGILLYEFWKLRRKETRPKVSQDSVMLIEKYVRTVYEHVKRSEGDLDMYVALRRVLLRGIQDEEEARAVIRFLRKTYMRLIHEEE
jgi:TrmH family RNA methyltransferase